MAVLIDTSVVVDVERRRAPLEALAGEEDRAISVVTASELLHGVHRAADPTLRMRRHAFVEGVLARLQPIPITMHVARAHAEIWARLEADGALIGAHDLWIAATALAHGMPVATVNARHFERVPGLEVLAVA
ncbi:MAG: PIN domain-containing protein [Actinobacteria bacterium]|nr:PIN domain-containing protein [Actinomycetota bacterium]